MAEYGNKANQYQRGKLKHIRTEPDVLPSGYGKVQPQAVDLEMAVLGGIMLDKDAFPKVYETLRPESFYKPAHVLIFEAMFELYKDLQPIDTLTVAEKLKQMGTLEESGGIGYLIDLTNQIASAANIEYHAKIVAQKFIKRELIRVSTQIVTDSFEDNRDVFDLLDEAESSLFEITDRNLRRGYNSLSELVGDARKKLEELSNKKDGLTGVPSGFKSLDQITSGWQPSDLIIVAARPGMGKTSFTLALALNAAQKFQKPMAVFSLEMSNIQLVQRMISMESEIESRKLRNGQLEEYEWFQLDKVVEKLTKVPVYIDDTPAINVFELRAKCRRLHQQHKIEMVIIDYLQLMSSSPNDKRGNREQEISTISRSLKGLAKELNIPVIALSQLSRAVETRGGDKRPQLSDLRESGAIEQDADIVTFIYRPDYYDLAEPDDPKGMTEIIIAKHRNGALGTVKLKFTDKFAKFSDLDIPEFSDLPGDDFNSPFKGDPNIITRPSRLNDPDEAPF